VHRSQWRATLADDVSPVLYDGRVFPVGRMAMLLVLKPRRFNEA